MNTCYRTAKSIKRRLDVMIKRYGENKITIDHGVANYEFDHYEFTKGSFKNNYVDTIEIFVRDFDRDNSVISYMVASEESLRKPNKKDWFTNLIHCSWDSKYPTILYMRDYCTN